MISMENIAIERVIVAEPTSDDEEEGADMTPY